MSEFDLNGRRWVSLTPPAARRLALDILERAERGRMTYRAQLVSDVCRDCHYTGKAAEYADAAVEIALQEWRVVPFKGSPYDNANERRKHRVRLKRAVREELRQRYGVIWLTPLWWLLGFLAQKVVEWLLARWWSGDTATIMAARGEIE